MSAPDERAASPRRRRGARPRRGRLTRSVDFDRVYRRGRSHANRHLVIYAFPRSGDGEVAADRAGPRLGISVGRKVGGAVERNRVKRLLREAFWAAASDLREGYDFVLVARPEAGALAREHGEQGIERTLRDLIADGGLRSDGQ